MGQSFYMNGDWAGGIYTPTGPGEGNIGIAGGQGYRNGVADGGQASGWGGGVNDYNGIYLGGAKPWYFRTCRVQAFIIFEGTVLSAAQMAAQAAAMAKFTP